MAKNQHWIPVSSQFWHHAARKFFELANASLMIEGVAKVQTVSTQATQVAQAAQNAKRPHPKPNISPQADLFADALGTSDHIKSDAVTPPLTSTRPLDYSQWRVVVPTFEHAQLLLKAMQHVLGQAFIPPTILTMFAWTGQQAPLPAKPSAHSERVMRLYAELRQHEWLKQLFGANSNTDLLPLSQTLLDLCDELTQAWLPKVLGDDGRLHPEKMVETWQQALNSLALPVQNLVSEETKLVWTLWQGQLDAQDKSVQSLQKMLAIAEAAHEDLVWIAPTLPNEMEAAFLDAYAKPRLDKSQRQVHCIAIDWHAEALPPAVLSAWPRLVDESVREFESSVVQATSTPAQNDFSWQRLRLCDAKNLEDEATQSAQTIITWLQEGKQEIAVIAQDRVVSRRLRALLERAGVLVADETGWKLSTTRAAAALAAWFELVATRADTLALLDFLKTPFLSLFEDDVRDAQGQLLAESDKAALVMEIEIRLRRKNVVGSWDLILSALEDHPAAWQWITKLARLAHSYGASAAAGRRQLKEWTSQTLQLMSDLGLDRQLQNDSAGQQLLQMLQALGSDCAGISTTFSFSEWRAFLLMQMENTSFTFKHHDQRVVMLPLNGARLRRFDAVYLIGGDAKHLPSRPQDTLFFSNAVRRECGLQTREARQLQQLRDLAEVLLTNDEVVLSWQSELNGEFNTMSPWVEQVELDLARRQQNALTQHRVALEQRQLSNLLAKMPQPTAQQALPAALSASGFASLMTCPYQFFASRILGLSALDDLNDMPEKRDYGDWLHAILKRYHDELLVQQIRLQETGTARIDLLTAISDDFFKRIMKNSPAALGFRMRWLKVIPAYVAWADQRERDGWQYVFGEVWAEQKLQWEDGEILLRGRLDRIDARVLESGVTEFSVLDYKTKKASELKKRIEGGEDHQLAFYGLLQPSLEKQTKLAQPLVIDHIDSLDGACYVALELEREKTGDTEAPQYSRWKDEVKKNIQSSMRAIQHGAPLPAHGVDSACAYCEMRGLCRKGAW